MQTIAEPEARLVRTWTAERIKAEIRRRGFSVRGLSLHLGLRSNDVHTALTKHRPKTHLILAGFLGFPVHDLWPEWYTEEQAPRPGRAVPEEEWEKVLERLAAGSGLVASCKHLGAPSIGALMKRLKADASFAAKVEAVRHRKKNRFATDEDLAALIAAVRRGESLHEQTIVPFATIYSWRATRPDFYAKVRAAVDDLVKDAAVEQPRGGHMWRAIAAVSARRARARASLNWSGFIDQLKSNSVEKIAPPRQDGAQGLPTRNQFERRRLEDPSFARLVARTLSERVLPRGIVTFRRSSLGPSGQEQFTKRLRDDEIYSAVHAATSRLPFEMRDDVASDLVLAVLDGEVRIEDLPQAVSRYRREFTRMFDPYGRSLDAVIGENGFTLGHTMAAAYI